MISNEQMKSLVESNNLFKDKNTIDCVTRFVKQRTTITEKDVDANMNKLVRVVIDNLSCYGMLNGFGCDLDTNVTMHVKHGNDVFKVVEYINGGYVLTYCGDKAYNGEVVEWYDIINDSVA